MTKDLALLWIEQGFQIAGRCAFRKAFKKYYPAYMDDKGVAHEAQEIEYCTEINFPSDKKAFVISFGVIKEGVFIPIKMESTSIGIETLRLICKTVKELGWN